MSDLKKIWFMVMILIGLISVNYALQMERRSKIEAVIYELKELKKDIIRGASK